MLSIDEVCATILGQLKLKLGFWGVFGVSSREGTHFLGFLFLSISPNEQVCAMASCAEQHTLFCTSQAFRVVFGYPQVFFLWCFDVVLTNIVAGTSFTWI